MARIVDVIRRRIASLRMEKGWTKAELARKAGVHPTLIGLLENGRRRGLTVETLESLAGAFNMSPAKLIADEEEWLRLAGPAPPATCGPEWVQLRDLCLISRGAELPEGFIQPFWPQSHGGERETERETRAEARFTSKVVEFMKQRMLEAAEKTGGVWPTLVRQAALEVRRCFDFFDLRAFDPCEGSAGVAYVPGCPRIFKDATIFKPNVKVVIEPRTLLTFVDESQTAIPQTLVALVPQGKTRQERLRLAQRITALLNTCEPAELAPDVRWAERSYRPRVRQIAAIRMRQTITSPDHPAWVKVDKLTGMVARAMATKKMKTIPLKDAFAHCQEERASFPYRDDLAEAVAKASSLSCRPLPLS